MSAQILLGLVLVEATWALNEILLSAEDCLSVEGGDCGAELGRRDWDLVTDQHVLDSLDLCLDSIYGPAVSGALLLELCYR